MVRIHYHKRKRTSAEAWASDRPPWKVRNRNETKEVYMRRLERMREYMRHRRATEPGFRKKEYEAVRARLREVHGDQTPQRYFKREHVKEILRSIAGEPYDDGLRVVPTDASELRGGEGPLHRVLGENPINQTPTKKQQVDEK